MWRLWRGHLTVVGKNYPDMTRDELIYTCHNKDRTIRHFANENQQLAIQIGILKTQKKALLKALSEHEEGRTA